jgi:hypothetical protein
VADPVQLSASVDAGFNNSTPGSGVAACGLGGLASSFLGGVVKGALITGAIIGVIALLPEELAIGATIGLATLGAVGAAKLAQAWKGMTANQKAEAAGEVAGGFLAGGVAGLARGAAGRSASVVNNAAKTTELAAGAGEDVSNVATTPEPTPIENPSGVPEEGAPGESDPANAGAGGINDAIQAARNSTNPGTRLEGEAAAEILNSGNEITGFNNEIGPNGSTGEIDIETPQALVEVTVRPGGKLAQIQKLMGNPAMNPTGKPVILYAPKYGGAAGKSIEQAGGYVARTPQELTALLNKLKVP